MLKIETKYKTIKDLISMNLRTKLKLIKMALSTPSISGQLLGSESDTKSIQLHRSDGRNCDGCDCVLYGC